MLGSHVQAPQLLPQGRGPVRVLSYARSLVIGAPLREEDVGTPPGKRPADGRADSGSPARAGDDGHAPLQPFFRYPALFAHGFSLRYSTFHRTVIPGLVRFPSGSLLFTSMPRNPVLGYPRGPGPVPLHGSGY